MAISIKFIKSFEISIVVKLGKLDVKFSHREKGVIFLNFKSGPQSSQIWPLIFYHNIGINTNNHL